MPFAFVIDLVLGGWKKYVAIGIGAVGIAAGAYILILRAENAQLALDVAQFRTALAECVRVNKVTIESHEAAKTDYDKAVGELTRKLAEKTAEKEKVRIVKERIREKAEECVGVDPANRELLDWLRNSPDRNGTPVR